MASRITADDSDSGSSASWTIRRGPLLMIGATVMFTIMVSTAKIARAELSALEVIAYRAVVSLPLAYAFAWRRGIGIHNRAGVLARSVLGFGAMTGYFTAAKGLSIADLSIIAKLQPILVALAAPLLLGRSERATGAVWLAAGAGIAGAYLLIGPELAVGSRFGLWALAATGFSAAAHLSIRSLGRSEDPRAIVFWFQAAILVLSLALHLATTGAMFRWPPMTLVGPLVLCGVSATVGQLLLTSAYMHDRAAPVAAAAYTAPLFGIVADLVVFGAFPSFAALSGGALVVGAGLLLVFGRKSGDHALSK